MVADAHCGVRDNGEESSAAENHVPQFIAEPFCLIGSGSVAARKRSARVLTQEIVM